MTDRQPSRRDILEGLSQFIENIAPAAPAHAQPVLDVVVHLLAYGPDLCDALRGAWQKGRARAASAVTRQGGQDQGR